MGLSTAHRAPRDGPLPPDWPPQRPPRSQLTLHVHPVSDEANSVSILMLLTGLLQKQARTIMPAGHSCVPVAYVSVWGMGVVVSDSGKWVTGRAGPCKIARV